MVDVAMLDCQVAILENAIARYVATGHVPGPLGARHPSIAPFAAYATARGHIVIAAASDEHWRMVADAIERPTLADDARFRTLTDRVTNADALSVEIEGALAARPAEQWLELLESRGLPCGPINNVAQALADPQVQARNMVVGTTDPRMPGLKVAGNPIKLSGVPDPATRGPVPVLDGDRASLMKELGIA